MSNGPSFECHITVPTVQAEAAAKIAEAEGWKTSEIARDPLLGDKNFYYLTKHDRDLRTLMDDMNDCVMQLLGSGVLVLREKIEVIIHDVRY